jgi:hypothetical protein
MRMKLLLVSLIACAGCAKQSTTNGTFGQADSQSAGQALAVGIEDSAKTYGPVNTNGAGADAACVTLSGDTTDSDQDTIPASATLTFNCTSTSLGYTGTVTGTEMITDTAPSAVAWAFSATADLNGSLVGPGGASITQARVGTIVATQPSNFVLARTLDVTTVFAGADQGASVTVTENTDWTVTFTPMLTWTPGGAAVTGSLTATGSWDVTVGNAAAAATLATPTALTLTPSCETRVTAGTVMATYQGEAQQHSISVTWTGCGTSTVTYH